MIFAFVIGGAYTIQTYFKPQTEAEHVDEIGEPVQNEVNEQTDSSAVSPNEMIDYFGVALSLLGLLGSCSLGRASRHRK